MLSKSLAKSRDMLKVIIYLNDRAELRTMAHEEAAMLQKIELAAATTHSNWKMPYKLKMLYFLGESEIMDYRTSIKNREKYLFVEDDG